ncbi:MAG: PD-(D/E)XK nuclease family protein, partial [Synergistales bacterium]|nr:PD-(D/E)XK nuclease family protein [Synergistales bacterium]
IHAGDLDIWEDCPFRFACMRVLDLDDPAPADRPDPAMEGNLLHALWERVWERYLKAEEPPRLTALAGELWGETVASVYPALRERFPGRELQLRRQVRDLAEEQQAWEDLLGSRRAGQYREWRVPPLAAGGLRLVGRCDRVERLDDGSLLILDYKRGSTSRYGQALQGAVYALALQEAGWPVAGYAYICHSDGGVKGVFAGEAHKLLKRPRKGNTPLEQKLDSAREKLEEMAADLRAGRYSLNRKSDSCAACGFRALCRRDEAPEEGAS